MLTTFAAVVRTVRRLVRFCVTFYCVIERNSFAYDSGTVHTYTNRFAFNQYVYLPFRWRVIYGYSRKPNAPLHLQGGATAEPCNGGSGCSASVSENHHA